MRYVLLILILGAFLPFSSIAEEHEGEGEVEKFDVVGSHIKKTTTEGASPVLVIDREQIEMSGYNSVSDVLRDLPVASLGGQREASLNDISSQTGTSIRGVRSSGILVLINGSRVAPVGGDATVDLNMIPISVIERIEILKEGTPLYGSDALGGVINVVTKSDYAGGQVNVQGSLVQREEGNYLDSFASLFDFWNWNDTGHSAVDNSWAGKGDAINIDASYGGNANDINYIVGGQVRFKTPMYLRDRSFGKPRPKHYSDVGTPGTWSNDGGTTWNPAPGCPAENVSEEGKCRFDYSPFMQFTPQVLQTSAFFQADKEINDITLLGRLIYNYTRSHAVLAPAPSGAMFPADVAQDWGLSTSDDALVLYRLVGEEGAGPREFVTNHHFFQAQFSAVKPFMNTLELEVELNLSGSHYFSEGVGGFAITQEPKINTEIPEDPKEKKKVEEANKKAKEALEAIKEEKKTGLIELAKAGKFNPIADKKNDISSTAYKPTTNTHSNVISLEPKFTGEIAEIGGQPLLFALGALGAWQRYNQQSDPISKGGVQWGGGVVSEGSGDRWSGGLYGELSSILFEMLELQLAARTDYYYSDIGFTGFTEQSMLDDEVSLPFSPYATLSFQPIDELKIRASWGLGFKAPTLLSAYHDEVVSYPFVVDYVNCPPDSYDHKNSKCDKKQREAVFKSNENLKPELSQSFNLGIIVEPVKEISFNIDYYRINQKNIIPNTTDGDSLEEFVRDIILHEQKHGVEKLKKQGEFNVERQGDNSIKKISVQLSNLAKYEVQGLDLGVNLSLPLADGWDFGLDLEHSHLLYVERQTFTDMDPEASVPAYKWMANLFGMDEPEKESTWYGYPRWRNKATLSVMNKDMGHRVHLVIHNIPEQLKAPEAELTTEHYWQLDLAGTAALSDNTSLTVGIRNVFDQERPHNELDFKNSGYVHSALYGIRGRTIDARLTYNFQ